VLCSPHLCETSYHFDSTSTSFPCITRPYPLHIDLNTLCSTVFLQLFFVLACILLILLQSHLIFWYIHQTLYMDPSFHLHTLSNHFWVRYWPLYHFISSYWPYRNSLPELCTFRSFSFQFYSVSVVVFWPCNIVGCINVQQNYGLGLDRDLQVIYNASLIKMDYIWLLCVLWPLLWLSTIHMLKFALLLLLICLLPLLSKHKHQCQYQCHSLQRRYEHTWCNSPTQFPFAPSKSPHGR